MEKSLLSNLNPPQREAVTYFGSPLLILAGAGSGKTRVLTYKIAYILQEGLAKPHEILAVTFTNKAANEMKSRVESLVHSHIQSMWIGTFHSVCARILRRESHVLGYTSNFTIYDADDQLQLVKRIMEGLNINKDLLNPNFVRYEISRHKNRLVGPGEYEKTAGDFNASNIAKVYWEYDISLRRNNAFDFDDLLTKPIEIFNQDETIRAKYQNLFKFILVDEYQDTNLAQYQLLKILSARHQNICVVGDEDQSIYEWRGANIANILNFERDFPNCHIVRLEENYRSPQIILDAANHLIAHNRQRLGKTLWSARKTGEPIQVLAVENEIQEANQVVRIIRQEMRRAGRSYNDFAILYRTNAQSRALEVQLRHANIPYQIVGGVKFYERKEIKDILAYLKILVNPNDSVSLRRIINTPTRGIGLVSLQHLENFAAAEQISLFEALKRCEQVTELKKGTANSIRQFVEMIEALQDLAKTQNAFAVAEQTIEKFKLQDAYQDSRLVENQSRLENIREFLNGIAVFVENQPPDQGSLEAYLQEISLVTDIDRWDPENQTVTLMTLHSAKGLEFPVVIICGLEDGLLPLLRSQEPTDDLEEERRLFYVGITRSQEKVFLLWAQRRRRFYSNGYGSSFLNIPSRFLGEIPPQYKAENTLYSRQSEWREAPSLQFADRQEVGEAGEYSVGQLVRHELFGEGIVQNIQKSSLGTKLTIRFQDNTTRKLIAEYAKLQVF